MSNDFVGYSRAGDVFHYRWAAKRCLKMIYPNSTLKKIVIEGSEESENGGEYVIDVSEYFDGVNQKGIVHYTQLKHSTIQLDNPFNLSDLKETIEGFALRYRDLMQSGDYDNFSEIRFNIVTNRQIAPSFKSNINSISKSQVVDNRFMNTLVKYTKLKGKKISLFCSLIRFDDRQGGYSIQKDELRIEIERIRAGSVDNVQVEALEAMVKNKVLPNDNGIILKEDVLIKFGVTSESQLYPAPGEWEEFDKIIKRTQHDGITETIKKSVKPIIVHATGGVGKSVFCQQFIRLIASGSFGVAYDCFGAGSYRSRSRTRHRHQDALVQIANELASHELCDPLIPFEYTTPESIMKSFMIRIKASIECLKEKKDSAQLFILIDAADNSEMAANEFNQSSFAHELLREQFPDNCRLIFLCRSERIDLLKPPSEVVKVKLNGFDEKESLSNLREHFPRASTKEGKEFHRLTGGNPRVQAYTLDQNLSSILEILDSFGTSIRSVDEQIGAQLKAAVNKVKDQLTHEYQPQIKSICLGLASLPPFIPIKVLSKASGIDESTIESFIAHIGRSLWLTDSSVQFRDEPTESWFRKTYIASKDEIKDYIKSLEPFATKSSYISEVLPQLYLQAEEYDKLIQITLTDQFLPDNNPADARTIRVYRLQFAFKASLKIERYDDAIKLAMRAGEEVAGNQRQLHLFQNNIDLLVQFQGKEKVQELAFKRVLRNRWLGSENIFTASLLSGISHFHGESQNILRSAVRWLDIFFQEREKRKELDVDDLHGNNWRHDEPDIENDDILELATAHLNLFGTDSCLEFLKRFNPKEWIFDVLKELAERLIDGGDVEVVEKMLKQSMDKPYFTIAFTSELMEIGRIPDKESLKSCLNLLQHSDHRLKKKESFGHENQIIKSILFFLEACVSHELNSIDILSVLDHYVSIKGSRSVYDSFPTERDNYIRSLAIRQILVTDSDIELNIILPENLISDKVDHHKEREIDNFRDTIDRLIPWSIFRLRTIITQETSATSLEEIRVKSDRPKGNDYYNPHDSIPEQICSINCSILIFNSNASTLYLENIYKEKIKDQAIFNIPLRLNLLRASKRLKHLTFLNDDLEESTYDFIKSNLKDGPEEISNRYITLSRAVLSTSLEDAQVYFEDAINVVSKFGEELTDRWQAIVSISEKVHSDDDHDELAYRYIRCAEVVGENIREKHWDRSKAIAICTRLSTGVGISSLSRWRERDLGKFEWMLYAQIRELLSSKSISSSIGWALSKFLTTNQRVNGDFIDFFLENEPSKEARRYILNDLVSMSLNEGANGNCWSNLSKKASLYEIENSDLSSIIKSIDSSKVVNKYNDKSRSNFNDGVWDEIFANLNLLTQEGLDESIGRYEKHTEKPEFYRNPTGFWAQLLNRIGESNLWALIEILLRSIKIDRYDFQNFIAQTPKKWLKKVSAKRKWTNAIRQIGKRLAHDLSEPYGFTYFIDQLDFDIDMVKNLKLGVFEGLGHSTEHFRSSHFFGFVELASEFACSEKLVELIDFSLSRFETHVENEYGDGSWDKWLKPPDNVYDSIAMFIWTALGTPKMSVRWDAVHCVKTLAELGCKEVIDVLISMLGSKIVGAFNSSKYPFYHLHAQQYLLMAFARISLDKAELLKEHFEVFSMNCLSSEHIIIQKFSSETAINIETEFPGTYDSALINKIKTICNSPFPMQEEDYNYSTDSYFHKNNLVQSDRDFHFAWDFNRYWFEPLGNVFGVSGKQVEDIALEIIKNQWGSVKTGYNNDPRVGLWSQSYDRETWHDHGSYPKTDNFDFYLSYHAMMITASKLLKKMPVIKHKDWCDDEWLNWLSGHLLTRLDGKWLSDHRNPLPFKRPSWITESEEDWINNITEGQFVDAIVLNDNNETWLNIGGGWSEGGDGKVENFKINSALVSSETANSLMNALATCSDPFDYKLPDFDEERAEINSHPFILKGWIYKENSSEGLDKFDQYAGGVEYPHFSIGKDIVEKLSLTARDDGKYFYSPISDKPSIVCRSWSSEKPSKDEEADQAGGVIKASLQFLQELCKTLEQSLIFEVQINRRKDYRHRDDKEDYRQPIHKIYILSENGKLRSAEKNYKLR